MKINTIDHNSFQENINNYLQGAPDDTFTWFSGYRMRFFAATRPGRRHLGRLGQHQRDV